MAFAKDTYFMNPERGELRPASLFPAVIRVSLHAQRLAKMRENGEAIIVSKADRQPAWKPGT